MELVANLTGKFVIRNYPPEFNKSGNPCEEHIDWASYAEMDINGKFDVCIGLVIEDIMGEPDVTVNWLHMCPYAKSKKNPVQEGVDRQLLEVITSIG